ncbi:MAG: hypothetical protein KKB50_12910 [Planctomycetes bacterium]|nr:hypothetical protein [Planctomycetota bacterium]
MDTRFRFIAGFLTLLNAVLILVLCGMVVNLGAEVTGLKDVLASKQDLVNVAAPQLALFTEDKCTSCHTERRFLGQHNMRGEIDQALAHMSALPDTNFSDDDMAKIHASLALMRCTQCHGAEKLKLLSLKSPEERMEIISRMIAKPDSKLSPDEAEAIARSYELLSGF